MPKSKYLGPRIVKTVMTEQERLVLTPEQQAARQAEIDKLNDAAQEKLNVQTDLKYAEVKQAELLADQIAAQTERAEKNQIRKGELLDLQEKASIDMANEMRSGRARADAMEEEFFGAAGRKRAYAALGVAFAVMGDAIAGKGDSGTAQFIADSLRTEFDQQRKQVASARGRADSMADKLVKMYGNEAAAREAHTASGLQLMAMRADEVAARTHSEKLQHQATELGIDFRAMAAQKGIEAIEKSGVREVTGTTQKTATGGVAGGQNQKRWLALVEKSLERGQKLELAQAKRLAAGKKDKGAAWNKYAEARGKIAKTEASLEVLEKAIARAKAKGEPLAGTGIVQGAILESAPEGFLGKAGKALYESTVASEADLDVAIARQALINDVVDAENSGVATDEDVRRFTRTVGNLTSEAMILQGLKKTRIGLQRMKDMAGVEATKDVVDDYNAEMRLQGKTITKDLDIPGLERGTGK
jgi:hypothetical protein